jgi:uncharacterized SAM-binding protein YcdF (DUF218 family)
LLVDSGARSTLANVVAAARTARAVDASEVVLVTSSWHAPRAAALLRAAVHGSGSAVSVAASDERPPTRAWLRELACWAFVPPNRLLARRISGADLVTLREGV